MRIQFGKYLGLVATVSLLAACQSQYHEGFSTSRTVYFDFGSSKLNHSGAATVREASDILIKNQTRFKMVRGDERISRPAMAYLSGHTDTAGSSNGNQRLSEERVTSVRKEMLANGSRSSAVSTKAYGKTQPVVPGEGKKEAKNRRVEIRIVQ